MHGVAYPPCASYRLKYMHNDHDEYGISCTCTGKSTYRNSERESEPVQVKKCSLEMCNSGTPNDSHDGKHWNHHSCSHGLEESLSRH